MPDYLPVKKSQIQIFKTTPFYFRTEKGEYRLYKKNGDVLDPGRTLHPDLFIHADDKETALKELTQELNMGLAREISKGGLVKIKTALCNIVEEALTPGQETAVESLPETISILLNGFDRDHATMDYLARIATRSQMMVEHTVNVTALTLQYCFFHDMPEQEAGKLTLCTMLHDVGITQLDKNIIESDSRLTEKQFNAYITHPVLGHDIIIEQTDLDIEVATVALEHHERLDGTGYPNGTTDLSPESQIIGLIDSYEQLTYRSKQFRKAKRPFDALSLIKDEVIQGKFSKKVFKKFTSCLIR